MLQHQLLVGHRHLLLLLDRLLFAALVLLRHVVVLFGESLVGFKAEVVDVLLDLLSDLFRVLACVEHLHLISLSVLDGSVLYN